MLAYYTSQKLFGPLMKAAPSCWPRRKTRSACSDSSMGVCKSSDQEIRGGRQLVDTPLINPQDNRMVPNTFDGATLVSLPDKDRNYDYCGRLSLDIKQRDSNDFISDVRCADGRRCRQPRRDLRDGQIPAVFRALRRYSWTTTSRTSSIRRSRKQSTTFKEPKEVPNWIIGANVIGNKVSELICSPEVPSETYQASAKVQMTYAGWTLFVAGSITGVTAPRFSRQYGTKPNYTDMQQVSFDNAGEKAIGAASNTISARWDFPVLAQGRGTRMVGTPSTRAPTRNTRS